MKHLSIPGGQVETWTALHWDQNTVNIETNWPLQQHVLIFKIIFLLLHVSGI